MSAWNCVPVVDVKKDNFAYIWPSLVHAITCSSFIAIDLELSGLGNRKALALKSVEDRYKAISDAAKSRSVVSLGLSCYRHVPLDEPKSTDESEVLNDSLPDVDAHLKWTYNVQTFNITLLCMDDYVVEPKALQFLVKHDFDFNKQYSQGIPYVKGDDKREDKKCETPSMRLLLHELMDSKRSIVFHNGLVDLIFLYQNFYAELPSKFQTFLADVQEMFSGGIFDTKYMSEFKLHLKATFLEYVFRKMQRFNENQKQSKKLNVHLIYPVYPPAVTCVEYKNLEYTKSQGFSKKEICDNFSNYGWCSKDSCEQIHDVNIILDVEESTVKKKKRKRIAKQQKENGDCEVDCVQGIDAAGQNNSESLSDCVLQGDNIARLSVTNESNSGTTTEKTIKSIVPKNSSTHRASCDAFMTGFILAAYLASLPPFPDLSKEFTLGEWAAGDCGKYKQIANHVFLSGKNEPLLIQKSNFVKTSKAHQRKLV